MAADASDRLENVLSETAQPQEFELTTPEAPLSTRQLQAGIDGLRDRGIDDNVIRKIFSERKASKAEHAAIQEFKPQRMGDAWVKRLLAGGHDERRELLLISAVLSPPVADK